MATQKTKVLAKKYENFPLDQDHKFYGPKKLQAQLILEGKSEEEIKTALISYIISERQNCVNDINYFANNYGFIIGDGSIGIMPFTIEPYQDDLLSSFKIDKHVIVVKARQLGVSTVLMFYALWLAIFSQGKRILVVAHRKESAEEFITKLKTAYEFLPSWLKPACTLYSKSTVEFETKSVVKAITSNPQAARSFSASVFLVDEAAFIPNADAVITGLMPTIAASDGKLIAISTPNGNSTENWFYNTFSHAKSGQNGWKWFEIPWHKAPKYTKNPNFKQEQIRIDNGNVDKFLQEYECFVPGTGVLTSTGMINIENVKVNDLVVAHSGRLRKVNAIMNKHYTGKMYKISTYGSGEPFICTPEHPIRTYNVETCKYSWTEAKDISKKDFVVFPKSINDNTSFISDELVRLLAWYITEGSTSKNQITFSLSNENQEKNIVISLLDKLGYSYFVRQTTGWQIHVNNTKLVDFFASNCGILAENKRIPFSLITGKEDLFFDELMLGDGCHTVLENTEKYTYGTISRSLAYQVQLLANSLNRPYVAGITKKPAKTSIIEGRTVNCSEAYSVQIQIQNKKAKSHKLYRTKYSVIAHIKDIEIIDYIGPVYNLSVQYDNSYIVNGRAVHNCVFDVNLTSLFSRKALNAFNPSTNIMNKTFGGATYEDTLWVWKVAEPQEKYVIGVDCASNKQTAKDYSAFQVINSETYEQVAEYMGKLPTEVMVEILIKTARIYNNAQLIIEDNSYSEMVFYLLDQKHYNNIWYREDGNHGFQTSKRTRPMLLEKLILFYNNPVNSSKLKSPRLKRQMENFSATTLYADGSRKIEASRGNDDLCMALALSVISLTPKQSIHRPSVDYNVMVDAKNINSGEYSQEYLEYNAYRMGISPTVLESRLKMYHAIKSGAYDGSGVEDLPIQHPVEEFDRQMAAKDFVGDQALLITDNTRDLLDNISVVPTDRRYAFDDIFDERLGTLMNMHQNFLSRLTRR